MEQVSKTVENAVLLDTYRELLPQVTGLPLKITGTSMTPFLIHHRDSVWLTAIHRPLRVGDIVLYQRDGGQYVLHRICAIRQDHYTLVGDAQVEKEPNIRRDQIFGLVTKVQRNHRCLEPGSFWWEFFEKVWIHVVPLRPWLLRCTAEFLRLVRRKQIHGHR